MNSTDYKTSILIDKSRDEVYNAINNVRGWWSENVKGNTEVTGSEFLYNYKDIHISKIRITELVPGRKVAWQVLENQFNFTRDQNEWKDTKIVFDISENEGQTKLRFTHYGLTPEYECYNVCQDAWGSYIQGSLNDLITTGKGKPNTKEDDSLNRELIEKWGLPKK
jgi:hypothetical protein